MKILQYPKDLQPGQVDYVTFKSYEYRGNKVTMKKGKNNEDAGAPSSGADIILYMPTTTPPTSQEANWQSAKFEGPVGEIVRNLSSTATNELMALNDIKDFESGREVGTNAIENVKSLFEDNLNKFGPAAQQLGVGLIAGFAGTSANGLLALNRGQIYNPNVELLYQGPKLRFFGS